MFLTNNDNAHTESAKCAIERSDQLKEASQTMKKPHSSPSSIHTAYIIDGYFVTVRVKTAAVVDSLRTMLPRSMLELEAAFSCATSSMSGTPKHMTNEVPIPNDPL